jgi:hypothetical protein
MAKKLSSLNLRIVLTRLTEEQYDQLASRREQDGIPIAVQIRKAVSSYLKEDA